MERDGDPTEEGRDPEDDHNDANEWFFDLPSEAGERAQETQRELRSHVEENYEEARRRRELFRPIEAELIEEPGTKKKGGGLFGRKKKQESDRDGRRWASPGGMWTLDPTLAADRARAEAAPEPAEPQPNSVRRALQEAATEPGAQAEEWSTESFSEFAEGRSETVEEPGGHTEARMEYVEAPVEPKRSRWEEMFGSGDQPAFEETSSVEGMKALWGTSAGKTRRLAEGSGAHAGFDEEEHETHEDQGLVEEETTESAAVFEAREAREPAWEEPAHATVVEESDTEEDEDEFELEDSAVSSAAGSDEEPEEAPAPRSRWEEMMNRPAGDDTIEAMRRWATSPKTEESEDELPVRRFRLDEPNEDAYAASLDELTHDVELPEQEASGGLFGKVGRLFRKKKDVAHDGPVDYVAEASGEWLPPLESGGTEPAATAEPRGGWLRAIAEGEPETPSLEAFDEEDEDLEAELEFEADAQVAAEVEVEAEAEATADPEDEDDFDTESMFHTTRRWQDDLLAGRADSNESGDEHEQPEIGQQEGRAVGARAAYFAADIEVTPGSRGEETEPAYAPVASLDEEEDAWAPEEFEPAAATTTAVAESFDAQPLAADATEPVSAVEDAFYAVEPQAEPSLDDGWEPAGEDTRQAPEIRDFYADLEESWGSPQPGAAPTEPMSATEPAAPAIETFSMAPTESDEPEMTTDETGTPEPAMASDEQPEDEPTGWAGWQARVGGRDESADERTESPWASFGDAGSGGDEPPRSETTEAQPDEPEDEDDPWAHFRATHDDEPEPAVASAASEEPEESEEEPGWGTAPASWGTQEDSEEFAGAGEPPRVVSEVEAPEEDDDSWGAFPAEDEEPVEGFAPTSSFSEAAGDKAETPVADAPASFESVLGMIDDVTSEEGAAEPSALLRTPGASRRPLSERYQDPLLAAPPPLEPREPREPGEPADFGEDPIPGDAGGWRVARSTGVPADDEMDLVLRAFEAHAASDEEVDALPGVSRVEAAGQDLDGIHDLLGDAAESLAEEDDEDHPGGRPFTGLKGWAPQRTAAGVGSAAPEPIGAGARSGSGSESAPWPLGREGDEEIGFGSPPWGGDAAFESSGAGDQGGTRIRTVVREIVETGLLALLVFLAVRASFQNFRVEGQSMEPTLSDGEFLIVNKLVYSEVDMDRLSKFVPFVSAEPGEKRHVFHGPERGDVIVFRDPRNPDEDLIKRVIGLPGDKVEIVNGVVYINDMPLEEPYIETRWDGNKEARIIPADEYFVLGDNRSNSLDSRSDQIGLVHKDLIIGKAMLAYWPSNKFASTLSEKPECRPDPNCVSVAAAATGSAALPR